MKVWAIGDLHLSGAKKKPMERFGDNWKNHDIKIAAAWSEMVAEDDLLAMAVADAVILLIAAMDDP